MTSRRSLAAGAYLVATLPAVAALWWTRTLASRAPESAEWRAAFGEKPLQLPTTAILDFDGEANFPAFRLLHQALLSVPGADFEQLALACWLLAASTMVLVAVLLARTFPERPLARALGLGAVAAFAFSPGFGADWLVGARFRVFVPAVCTAAGALLLASPARSVARLAASGLLAGLALATDRTGVLTWIALLPLVLAGERGEARRRALVRAGVWCLLGSIATLACRDEPVTPLAPGIASRLLADPAGAWRFVLRAVGLGVPDAAPGPAADEELAGAVLLLALLALVAVVLVRRDAALRQRALPWIALGLHGAGSALLLALDYFPPLLHDTLLREHHWAGFFVPLSVAVLLALRWPAVARVLAWSLVTALVLLLGMEWVSGWRHLLFGHRLLRQGEAWLVLGEDPGAGAVHGSRPPLSAPELEVLRARGWLRWFVPVRGRRLDELATGTMTSDPGAGSIDWVEGRAIHGRARLADPGGGTDLVMLARRPVAGPEVVFRILGPDPELGGDQLPWRADCGDAEQFTEGERVRAYGFDARRRRLVRLRGSLRAEAGKLVSEEESG